MTRKTLSVLLTSTLFAACGGDPDPVGLPLLGAGSHDMAMVQFQVLADGFSTPTDVASNPNKPDQLWVSNYGMNAITILSGDDFGSSDTPTGGGANHFLVKPMSLAFADDGHFATIHDTDELTQGTATPEDFMGPVLWNDESNYNGGHSSHLDMLHNSPLGGGIAWAGGNKYWVFDGYNDALTFYDFKGDHGFGGADHSGAEIARYVEGEVSRTEGVPSHMDFDASTDLLYVADTNNGRIAVLDTTTGSRGAAIGPNYDGADQYGMDGATITTFIDGGAIPVVMTEKGDPTIESRTMSQPSGLELHNGVLYVTDAATSTILAFNLQGELIDWLPINRPAGSLGGLDITPAGDLVVVDIEAEEL
ncbi:MAG: hypothetical protein AB8H79_21835, partial [Myxococcota bacterium]